MSHRISIAVLAMIAILGGGFWLAREFRGGGQPHIAVTGAWTTPNPDVGGTAAVYLDIANSGDGPDTLIAAETAAADKAEFHESRMDGDIMRMQRLDSLEIAAGGSAAFTPGAMHVMLIGLKRSLADGDSFPLTLLFRTSGPVTTEVSVKKRDVGGMGDRHHEMRH